MDVEQMLRIANSALFAHSGRRLSEVEAAILLGSMQRHTYEQIAETSGYAVSYVKYDVGPKLWKRLGQALGETVSKTNFQAALEPYWQRSLIATTQTQALATDRATDLVADESDELSVSPTNILPVSSVSKSVATPYTDWGEGVDVSGFYGRSLELTTLTQWIVSDRCRLIALLGMGGIGKTALSVKLANQLLVASRIQERSEFEFVIWRSLRNAPTLETLLADMVLFLSNQQDTQNNLSHLMHYLRSFRCLVILDNLETILQGGDRAGQFRAGYEGYGELLQMVSESSHQSCLLFTSREKPAEVAAYEGVDFKVRSLQLSGSEQAAQAIMQAKGLVGSDAQKELLGDRYGNSPLALKIVATSIQDLFEGDIHQFLEQHTVIFNGIRRLLDQQCDRLSTLEQTIMYWLAINREWTSIAELHEDIIPAVSKGKLLESLESLNWRSLVEKRSGSYTQQPVVMEYMTERFIEQIATELNTTELDLFNSYALIKTTVKEYVRETQVRLILEPIAQEFRKTFRAIAAMEQQILRILTASRQSETKRSGYGAGNLINLCNYLKIDLTRHDFSRLAIRQAHLQTANLQYVNFTDADIRQSVFFQTFGSVLSVNFSPNGQFLATGDTNAEVRLWQVIDSQPLFTLQGHQDWVRSVCFSHDGRILFTGSDDQTIRLWDVKTGKCLKILEEPASRVGSLAVSSDGSILASSREDHSLQLWNVKTGKRLKTLEGHTAPVWSVAFSLESDLLASGSHDHTVKLWDIWTGECLKTLEGHAHWVSSVAFSPDGKTLASGSHDHTVKLWDIWTGECLKTLEGHAHWVWSVAFSPDGEILASGSEDEITRLWNVGMGLCLKLLVGHISRIWSVTFSPDGQMLATGSDDQTFKLWSVNSGECLKTVQGHSKRVWSVACSPDGQRLASSGDERIVRLWNVATGKCDQALIGHRNRIGCVVFSPDGGTLASSSEDQTIRLWDVTTGQCLKWTVPQNFSRTYQSGLVSEI